jgi:hypothetical protein
VVTKKKEKREKPVEFEREDGGSRTEKKRSLVAPCNGKKRGNAKTMLQHPSCSHGLQTISKTKNTRKGGNKKKQTCWLAFQQES